MPHFQAGGGFEPYKRLPITELFIHSLCSSHLSSLVNREDGAQDYKRSPGPAHFIRSSSLPFTSPHRSTGFAYTTNNMPNGGCGGCCGGNNYTVCCYSSPKCCKTPCCYPSQCCCPMTCCMPMQTCCYTMNNGGCCGGSGGGCCGN
ncbi:keratin, ultra high-sulfur matrix protein-like [Cygnus atratus]|uniref:keratin, ultra high-sulfur matrix protein-like n=1 Tax=Cygnus atratus TaxID=8868 RepID=UPI0015D64232|nr:keratin, ultra high-sulfur matrix protein-like [Cygnus atratus]